jgi:hypothetical protein
MLGNYIYSKVCDVMHGIRRKSRTISFIIGGTPNVCDFCLYIFVDLHVFFTEVGRGDPSLPYLRWKK